MKRLFFAVLAVATLASCAKEEAIRVDQGEAIAFGDAFVDNATRVTDPSFGAGTSFTEFNVWGTANSVAIFTGDKVTGEVGYSTVEGNKVANEWTCQKKNYWVKGVDYDFAAVAGVEKTAVTVGTDSLPLTISYTANGENDLIYAKTENITGKATGENGPVNFTFNHLLAKVKFTATTEMTTPDYEYEVSNITITNAYGSGVYTVGATTPWGDLEAKNDGQSFGNITVNSTNKSNNCDAEKLLIPIANNVVISCTVTLKYGVGNAEKQTIWTKECTGDNAITMNTSLVAAHAYNFTIDLNIGEEIKFSVTDNASWGGDADDNEVTIE